MNLSNIILNKSKQVPEVYIKLDVPLLQFIKKKKSNTTTQWLRTKKQGPPQCQWLRHHASIAGGTGSIPAWGTKIHMTRGMLPAPTPKKMNNGGVPWWSSG